MKFITKNGKPFAIPKSGWSQNITFNKENISRIPDVTGIYMFMNKDGHPIYVGRSHDGPYSGLRHRLQSYYEEDDFNEHPTKEKLRPAIHFVKFQKTSESEARKIEEKLKQGLKYNADNKMNEDKKHHVQTK